MNKNNKVPRFFFLLLFFIFTFYFIYLFFINQSFRTSVILCKRDRDRHFIKGLAISIFSIKREGPMLLALCSYQDCVSGRAPATDGRIMRVRAFIIFTSHCFPFPTIFIYGYHLKRSLGVRLYNVLAGFYFMFFVHLR